MLVVSDDYCELPLYWWPACLPVWFAVGSDFMKACSFRNGLAYLSHLQRLRIRHAAHNTSTHLHLH